MSEDPFHFKHLAFLSLYSPFQKEKKRKEGRLNPGRCRYTRPLRSAGSRGPFNLNLRDSPGPAGPGSVPGWELRSHMPCGTANKHTQNKTPETGRPCAETQQRDMGSGAGKQVWRPLPETARLLPRSGLQEAGQTHRAAATASLSFVLSSSLCAQDSRPHQVNQLAPLSSFVGKYFQHFLKQRNQP